MRKATAPVERKVARREDAASGPSPLPRKSPLDVEPRKSRGRGVAATGGAVVVHAALVLVGVALASAATAKHPHTTTKVSQLIDVEIPKPAPPPPEPPPPPAAEPEPEKPAPKPVRVRAPAPEAKREAPPPAAAEAGKVVTAANDVVDFGDTIVSGTGQSYAGGVTEAGGTSKKAVTDTRARAGGVEGGTGTTLGGDLSRAPQLAGGVSWDCPFPKEADELRIDDALVTLRVAVGQDGSVSKVDVTDDPGDGFGREARRCAQRKRWAPGIDRAGKPIAASALIKVRFERK